MGRSECAGGAAVAGDHPRNEGADPGPKGRGRFTIECGALEDFDRVVRMLKGYVPRSA